MKERMESLAKFLTQKAETANEKAKVYDTDYQTGMKVAFRLCAKWIREELEKGD